MRHSKEFFRNNCTYADMLQFKEYCFGRETLANDKKMFRRYAQGIKSILAYFTFSHQIWYDFNGHWNEYVV